MLPFSSDNFQRRSWSYGCLSGTVPGFTVLCRLLLNHISLSQIYGAFAALLFGKSDFHVPGGEVTGFNVPLPYTNIIWAKVHLYVLSNIFFHIYPTFVDIITFTLLDRLPLGFGAWLWDFFIQSQQHLSLEIRH